jgi:pyruvate dehydrogenase E1 component alpha subunit
VDGNDVLAVYESTQKAVSRARAGQGPTLIECKTYRWRGHCEVPALRTEPWRSEDELEAWQARCPIRRLESLLKDRGILNDETIAEMETRIQEDLENALAHSQASPDPLPDDAMLGLYASELQEIGR